MLPYTIYTQANPNRCLDRYRVLFIGPPIVFHSFCCIYTCANLLKTTTDVFSLETALKECRKVFVHLKFFVSISLLHVN